MILYHLYQFEYEFGGINLFLFIIVPHAVPEGSHNFKVGTFHFQIALHSYAAFLVFIDDDAVAFAQSVGASATRQWTYKDLYLPIVALLRTEFKAHVPLPFGDGEGGASFYE